MNFEAMRRFALPALVLAWFVVPSAADAATCATSPASLHGWYSMLVSGGVVATGAAKYEVGAVLFNGAGALSANNIYSGAGSRSAASGSYAQNADCTITVKITVGTTASTYTVAINNAGQAVGIETDATGVGTISFRPRYPTYVPLEIANSNSLNGTFAAACSGPLSATSDLNLVTFTDGALSGTDPFNNGGSFTVANVPYTGTYTVNTDGTFAGKLVVVGTPFDYYGVIDSSNTGIEYIYSNVTSGVATAAFSSCVGTVAPTASTPVNLAPYYNDSVIVSDGKVPAGGFSHSNYAYSANLLGTSVTWNGLVFPIGPANAADAVTGETVALPAGQFSSLSLLGSADYGPHTGTIVVTYSDGSTSSFTQSFSDWGLYLQTQPSSTEGIAAATAHRVTPSGASEAGPWYVFGYSFPLTKTKTVASVTLPASDNIIVLSAVLSP